MPTSPQPEQVADLGDMQDPAASPTSHLSTVVVNTDGTASLAVPCAEIDQGMTTAIANRRIGNGMELSLREGRLVAALA